MECVPAECLSAAIGVWASVDVGAFCFQGEFVVDLWSRPVSGCLLCSLAVQSLREGPRRQQPASVIASSFPRGRARELNGPAASQNFRIERYGRGQNQEVD